MSQSKHLMAKPAKPLVLSSPAAKLCGIVWAGVQSVPSSVWCDFLCLNKRIKNASVLTIIFLLKKEYTVYLTLFINSSAQFLLHMRQSTN